MKSSAVCAVLFFIALSAQSKTPAKAPAKPTPPTAKPRRSVDLTRSVRIQYSDPTWNRSPTQTDSGSVIIRDANTGKMVRVQVTETGTDSGVFNGIYSISWKEIQVSNPEIYAVPPEKRNDKIEASSLSKLKRLPYVFRKDEKDQLIEAFPTREEAERSLEAYRKERDQRLKKSDDISDALIETAEKSKKMSAERQRLQSQKQREAERMRSLSAEAQRLAVERAAFAKLPKAEQEKRKKDALAYMNTGMGHYQANRIDPAEENFKKAFDLDPTNQDLCYYYGVTLYKKERFSDSLVYLELAEKGNFNPLERDFFKGLNYYRLDEHERALEAFGNLKRTQDKVFGPTAAFYEALVKMKMEKYDEAKEHFQEVLDTSSDPALDQSAEDYIEKIEQLKAYLKQKSKKYFFTASAGMQYDSNVLATNSSSPTAADPTRIADIRYVTGLSAEYRPVYSEKHEFSVKGKADSIYSTKGDNVAADPLMYSLKGPYKYKSILWGKGYKLEVVPGYEVLNLDENRSGATTGYLSSFSEKENYLNSLTLDILNSLVMRDDHIMGVNFKYRSDKSESLTAVGDNEPTAVKLTLEWQNIYFLNQKKNLGLIGTLGYTANKATGRNLTYNRYDLSAMCLFPVGYEFTGVGGLSYYQADYPEKSPQARTDTDLGVTLNLIRPLNEWLNLTLGGTYTNNQSNLEANTYNKYLLMAVVTANWSL